MSQTSRILIRIRKDFSKFLYRNPLNNGAALLLAVAYNAGALDYVLQQLTISAGGGVRLRLRLIKAPTFSSKRAYNTK